MAAKLLLTRQIHNFNSLINISRNNLRYSKLYSKHTSRLYPSKTSLKCDYNQVVLKKLTDKSRKLFENGSKKTAIQSRTSFNFFKKDSEWSGKRRVPKLILLQNPITWIMVKIDFSVLRNIWDPSFELKEFKHGTKQVYIIIKYT